MKERERACANKGVISVDVADSYIYCVSFEIFHSCVHVHPPLNHFEAAKYMGKTNPPKSFILRVRRNYLWEIFRLEIF